MLYSYYFTLGKVKNEEENKKVIMELQSLQDEKSSLIQSNQALNEQLHFLNQQSNNLIAENNRDKESLQRQLNTQVQKYKQLKNEKLFIERSHKLE